MCFYLLLIIRAEQSPLVLFKGVIYLIITHFLGFLSKSLLTLLFSSLMSVTTLVTVSNVILSVISLVLIYYSIITQSLTSEL